MNAVCIDFGDRSTASAYPYYSDGKFSFSNSQLDSNGRVVIKSRIALNRQQINKINSLAEKLSPSSKDLESLGEIFIGDEIPLNNPGLEIFSYFKAQPLRDENLQAKSFDDVVREGVPVTHGQLMACFFYKLVKNICSLRGGIGNNLSFADLDIFVGCPASPAWTGTAARKKYHDLLMKALNVRSVTIIPESRAAAFSSIASGNERYSAAGGIAVCDFGSLTADFSYMLLGRKKIEFSWNLGASLIEKEMTQIALESAQAGIVSQNSCDKAVNKCCEFKEDFYSGQIDPAYSTKTFTFTDDINQQYQGNIRIDERLMEMVVSKRQQELEIDAQNTLRGSWKDLLRKFFEDAKDKIKGLPLDTIVLSGGASKMGFVKDVCSDVFEISNIRVDKNPSLTIANGLAVVAVIDKTLPDCILEVAEKLTNDECCNITTLKNILEEKIFEVIKDELELCVEAWKDSDVDRSLKDLNQDFDEAMKSAQLSRDVARVTKQGIAEWKRKLSQKIVAEINNKVNALYSQQVTAPFVIPNNIWEILKAEKLDITDIDMSEFLKFLEIDFTSGFRKIAQWLIVGVCTGGGVAVGGILGGFVGFTGGVIAAELLADTSVKTTRDKDKREDASPKILEKFVNNKEFLLSGFDKSFSVFNEKFSDHILATVENVFKIITLQKFTLNFETEAQQHV
ncbi:MAG: hypothetical protein II948_00475 [Synergistaceae bacterium]|nr:hypothetical protein [Synergistaceae bacterium]